MSSAPEPGSVPDLWRRARAFRWRSRMFLALGVVWCALYAVVTTTSVAAAFLRALIIAMVFMFGATWNLTKTRAQDLAMQAWTLETAETLQGLADSGLYSPLEALEAMREGPVPPIFNRKQWIAAHDELMTHYRGHG